MRNICIVLGHVIGVCSAYALVDHWPVCLYILVCQGLIAVIQTFEMMAWASHSEERVRQRDKLQHTKWRKQHGSQSNQENDGGADIPSG